MPDAGLLTAPAYFELQLQLERQMNADNLTTARWHLLNSKMPWNASITPDVIELINDKLGYPAPGTPVSSLVPIAPLPAVTDSPYIALCLGHGRDGDEGNIGAGGVSEEDYNLPLIEELQAELSKRGIQSVIISHYAGNGYSAAMNWLASELKELGVTAAIEFHYNAYEGESSGHETLYWESSKRGITLAKSILQALDQEFPDHPSRGIQPKSANDRGALFLSLTHCPAVIAEPFFGDNPTEWARFSSADGVAQLVQAYANGISNWIATLA